MLRRGELWTVPITLPILPALAAAIGSVVVKDVPGDVALFALRVLFQPLLFYYLGFLFPKNRRWLQGAMAVFIGASVALALHGLYQFASHAPMPASWIDVRETGIGTRAYSIVQNPNGLGAFLLLGTIVSLSLALGRGLPGIRRAWAGAACLIQLAGVAVTFSRGAWIGLAAGILALLIVAYRRYLAPVVAAAVVAWFVMPRTFVNRLTFALSSAYLTKSMAAGRLYVWKMSLQYMASHPWFGVGLGSFGEPRRSRTDTDACGSTTSTCSWGPKADCCSSLSSCGFSSEGPKDWSSACGGARPVCAGPMCRYFRGLRGRGGGQRDGERVGDIGGWGGILVFGRPGYFSGPTRGRGGGRERSVWRRAVRSLRVLHVIGGGDTGGAMSHLLPLLSALGRTGCEVHLLCLGGGGLAEQARDRGLSVVVLPMKGAYDPRVLSALRRVLRTDLGPVKRWDVVHTHGMRANLPVRMTLRTIRRRPASSLLCTPICGLTTPLVAWHTSIWDWTGLPGGVDRVVCVSDASGLFSKGVGIRPSNFSRCVRDWR